jgi:type IV pilus assembly protein PilB
MGIPRQRVGEMLLAEGLVTEDQLQLALRAQQTSNRKLGEILVDEGVISASVLTQTLSRQYGQPACVLRHGLVDPALLAMIGEDEALRLTALPLFRVHDTLTVAMSEPDSLPKQDRLRDLTGCRIRPVLALHDNILEYIGKYAGDQTNIDSFLASLEESEVHVVERERIDDGPAADIDTMVTGSPIVNLVNIALLTAVRDGASDVHIEPEPRGTRIRYRVDGMLRDLMKPPAGIHAALVSRIKVIGRMNIAEKRLPQEGRIRIVAEGREIDLRVSSMPTLLGEKLVIRVLDKRNLNIRLDEMGFRKEALASFHAMLAKTHGQVLVTGPTGSGKTTTLYSALDLLCTPERNIVTVEDPVEYQLDLINQIQAQDAIGLTFARALRSILRQDPDIIMVGEIRDQDTARVAVQAALTGHLVLATLHTNDAAGAVARLLDMGVESYLLSSALNGVVAQRLARTLCPGCKTKYYPTAEVLEDAHLTAHVGRAFQHGAGCQQCHDSGFQGRLGIYEVMEVTGPIRRLIHHGAPSHELRDELRRSGAMTLRQEGAQLALEGRTSVEEILRVTQIEDIDKDAAIRADDASAGKGVAA